MGVISRTLLLADTVLLEFMTRQDSQVRYQIVQLKYLTYIYDETALVWKITSQFHVISGASSVLTTVVLQPSTINEDLLSTCGKQYCAEVEAKKLEGNAKIICKCLMQKWWVETASWSHVFFCKQRTSLTTCHMGPINTCIAM